MNGLKVPWKPMCAPISTTQTLSARWSWSSTSHQTYWHRHPFLDMGAALVLPMLRRCDYRGNFSILNVTKHTSKETDPPEVEPASKILRTITEYLEHNSRWQRHPACLSFTKFSHSHTLFLYSFLTPNTNHLPRPLTLGRITRTAPRRMAQTVTRRGIRWRTQ